jgi:hypothetical protein
MSSIFGWIKKVFFWRYGRTTWQYDVLCVLILAFIFLTPKSWFQYSELRTSNGHPSGLMRFYIPVDGTDNSLDRGEIEQRVRALTGRPDAKVTNVDPKKDAQGRTVAVEVDIQ